MSLRGLPPASDTNRKTYAIRAARRISHRLESHASHLTFNGGRPHAPLGSSLLDQRYRKGRQRNYLAHYGPEYLLG